MKRSMLYALGIMSAAAAGAYSLDSAAFWVWVTATPLTEAQLAGAQQHGRAWMAAAGCGLAVLVILALWVRGGAPAADRC